MVNAGGRPAEGLALLDSVIAGRRAAGDTLVSAYMTAQRVPMLLRLQRDDEAEASVQPLARITPHLAQASTWHGDVAMYAGMAAMAGGRYRDAVMRFDTAVQRFDLRYPESHPRRAMARCALGAALAHAGRRSEAMPLLAAPCDLLSGWGLADPSVASWGRRARELVKAVDS
jgi:hypothetical protein